MAYNDNKEYAKYLKNKITSGCSDCGGGCDDSTDDCKCCPNGLVAVYDESGNRLGCLTPNDAQEFTENTRSCPQGYAALYKNGDPNVFLGCVSESEFASLYTSVNPAS